MDESNAELLAGTLTRSTWGPAPLIPPPPTGPLAPPAPPPLAPDLVVVEPPAGRGAHRSETAADSTEPTADSDVLLSDGLRAELERLLGRSGGRLQEVFEHQRRGVTSPALLAAAGAALSEASAAELMLHIQTVLGEPWGGAAGRARPMADTARVLMTAHGLSDEALDYLADLRLEMLDLADSAVGRQQEQALLEANSATMADELRTTDGVFVYTFPHYWRHPYLMELNRRLLRIDRTREAAWTRVLEQADAADVPERPVLLRLYAADDPTVAEQTFHRLLNGAHHADARTDGSGRKWYATTLEFLDEIAMAQGCRISAGAQPVH